MSILIIRVVSLKGGVGKSTISAYLVKYLQEFGNKVLLVDKDNLRFSSFMLKLIGANNVEIVEDLTSKEEAKNYNYVVVDYPTPIKSELLTAYLGLDDIMIFASDIFSIGYVQNFAKEIKGIKILVVNMVSPFPEDIKAVADKVKDSDFSLKAIIPFIPKLFMNVMRNVKCPEVKILKELSLLIERKDFHGQVLLPF